MDKLKQSNVVAHTPGPKKFASMQSRDYMQKATEEWFGCFIPFGFWEMEGCFVTQVDDVLIYVFRAP